METESEFCCEFPKSLVFSRGLASEDKAEGKSESCGSPTVVFPQVHSCLILEVAVGSSMLQSATRLACSGCLVGMDPDDSGCVAAVSSLRASPSPRVDVDVAIETASVSTLVVSREERQKTIRAGSRFLQG